MIETPYLLFLGDAPDMLAAKVAIGIRDWRPENAVGQIRLPGCGADLGLNENHLREIRRAMYAVSNSNRGTAYRSRIVDEAFRMAGKTGTSQVRNISSGERATGVMRNSDLPRTQRDHALFVDFAPYDAPKYAVAVVVEHGGGGSTAAAPIARDITLQALYNGDPPLSAYPSSDRPRIRTQQEELQREYRQSDRDESDRA